MDRKTLAEIIKQRREELCLSCEAVTETLKIPGRYLRYLEQNAVEKLPPKIYVEGFLKKYSDILGLDRKLVLRLYEHELREAGKSLPDLAPMRSRPQKIVVTPKRIMAGTIGISLAVLGFYLWKQVSFFVEKPQLEITSPRDDISSDESSIMVEGKTQNGNRVTINDQLAAVDDDGNFKENIVLRDGLNILNITVKNLYGKEKAVTRKVLVGSAEKDNENILTAEAKNVIIKNRNDNPEEQKPASENDFSGELKVSIQVKDESEWMKATIDKGVAQSGVLLPGVTKDLEASREIELKIGRPYGVWIALNGGEFERLGEKGELFSKVIITKEGIKKI